MSINAVNRSGEVGRFPNGQSFVAARLRLPLLKRSAKEQDDMWKVDYKHANASSSWTTHGTYGSESSAMSVAAQIAHKDFATRVVDPNGNVVWSA